MIEKILVLLTGIAFIITGICIIFILSKIGVIFLYKIFFYGLGTISIIAGYRTILLTLKNL